MAINLGSTAIADAKLGDTQVDKICLGDTVVWEKQPAALKALKFSSTGSQTLGVVTGNLGTISPNFEYSTDDGATWTTWNVSQTLSFGNGTDLYVRGMNTSLAKQGDNYTQFQFSTSSPVECSGNVMHLFDYTQDLTTFPDTSSSARGLKRLFRDASQLVSVPELGVTDLTGVQWAYEYMFAGCFSLTTAPALPATTLAGYCYQYMFDRCFALTTAPALPATTLSYCCYDHMFQYCAALATIPALPATTLAGNCYNSMFSACTLIKMSETQEGEYQNAYTFGAIPSGTYASNMFSNTGGTFKGTPTTQTLYTSNTIVS